MTMTGWTTPADLRAQLQRRWDRGELLAELAAPAGLFPLRLALKGPSSAELSDQFDAVRGWAAALRQGAEAGGYRVVMRELRHRVIGSNSLPEQVWVDTLDAALRLIGRARDAKAFGTLLAAAAQQQPALLPWLQRQPLRALALAGDWPRLLGVVGWLQAHPRPQLYLRQVDLPGVHSKFIEAQRGVLAEWLDLALPAAAIDTTASGAANFARRYGFIDKPARVRLRFLDATCTPWLPGTEGSDGDLTLSAAAFARLQLPVQRVFITENEVNFLAFPPVAAGMVVFGAGYGFDALAQAGWVQRCSLHHWGDIDTHGFAILDELRSHFPHAQSLLMDRDTLLAHEPLWGDEPEPTQRDLARLNDDERRLYDDLRWRRLRDAPLRLEQERIAFGRVQQAVAMLRPAGPIKTGAP